MNITEDECAECGSTLEQVRPGKWQCSKCELDNMLKQAHRSGWEQAKAETELVVDYLCDGFADTEEIQHAIAAMEYKEKANGLEGVRCDNREHHNKKNLMPL